MLGMLAMKEVWISNPLAQLVGGAPHASGRGGGAAAQQAICAIFTW